MYFIDLALRNTAEGYVDSVALIAEVTGAPEVYRLRDEAERFAAVNSDNASDNALEALHEIIAEAEGIAADYGFQAFAFDGFQFVMTEEEYDEFWNEEE